MIHVGRDKRRSRAAALRFIMFAALTAGGLGIFSGSSGASTRPSANRQIVIGGIFNRTGEVPLPGEYEAATAYFAYANSHGGINGYKIKFTGLDDQTNPQMNASDMLQLVSQDKAQVILEESELAYPGGVQTAISAKVPVVGGGSNTIEFSNPDLFPIYAFEQGSLIGGSEELLKALHINKIATLTSNVTVAEQGQAVAEKAFAKAGDTPVYNAAFPETETDFSSYVAKMQSAGVKIVYCLCVTPQAVAVLKAAALQNYPLDLIQTGFGEVGAAQVGPSGTNHYFAIDPQGILGGGAAATQAAKIVHSMFPSVQMLADGPTTSWTAAQVIADAIKLLGKAPPTSANLIVALNKIKDAQLTYDPPMTYAPGPKHPNPTQCVQITVAKGNQFVLYNGKRYVCFTGSVSPATLGVSS